MNATSHLQRVLEAGHFAVTAELGPPQSADAEVIIRKAGYFRGYADAVNVTDCQSAIVRMSSVASCAFLVREGLDCVMQMTCRDRNRIGMQSDLLGAWALGIRNVLCLSGDHPRFGNQPDAKFVGDIDSLQLVQMVRKMREEQRFLGGEAIKIAPAFYIGAACNPFAPPFEWRAHRLAKKVAAGADFIQTQAIFDIQHFARFMRQVRELGLHEKVKILAGVLPARSAKALRTMNESIPGLLVPQDLVRRMEQAAEPQEEGVRICVEFIEQLREIPGVAGVHIMPVMWESILPTIVERAGLLPRPEMLLTATV